MPKITPIKASELVDKLKKLWFKWPFPWWRHMFMVKWSQRIPFPQHWWKDISRWVVQCIIKQINISVDEWNKL